VSVQRLNKPLGCPRVESQRDSVPQPRVGAQRLPWVRVSDHSQPQRGCGHLEFPVAATPLGLASVSAAFPKVARSSQPWALRRNPVGILRVSSDVRLSSQPSGLPEGRRGSQRSEDPRSTSSNVPHPGGVPERRACVTKSILHPSGVRTSLIHLPGVSSRSTLLNPRLPYGKPPACPDSWSRSDLLTVAVGFSPRIIERNRPRRYATLERPALTSTSSLATRGMLPWTSDPRAEAHGYRHILALRGHRGASRSLFS